MKSDFIATHFGSYRHLASYIHFNGKSKILQLKTRDENEHNQFNFLYHFYSSCPFQGRMGVLVMMVGELGSG
jgi:hypothetical protein